jgi:hypothetical protein
MFAAQSIKKEALSCERPLSSWPHSGAPRIMCRSAALGWQRLTNQDPEDVLHRSANQQAQILQKLNTADHTHFFRLIRMRPRIIGGLPPTLNMRLNHRGNGLALCDTAGCARDPRLKVDLPKKGGSDSEIQK